VTLTFRFQVLPRTVTYWRYTYVRVVQLIERLATGWAVRGSNLGGGEIFRTRQDRPWVPPSFLYNGYRVFPGGKTAGEWRWPPTPSNTEVKERVDLYFYSPSGSSWLFYSELYITYLYKNRGLTLGYRGNSLLPNISVCACVSVRKFCWANGHVRLFE
jgi:hypothetical protein